MQKLEAKEGTLYINQVSSRLGDHIDSEGNRYDLNIAHEVCLPDSVDISVWKESKDEGEGENKKDALQVYMEANGLTYEPLKDEERRAVVDALRAERAAQQK